MSLANLVLPSVLRISRHCHTGFRSSFNKKLAGIGYLSLAVRPLVTHPGDHSNQFNMRIQILEALSDNYMYLLTDEAHREAVVVDPVEPGKVVDAINGAGVALKAVLTTHHHWDHAGGNQELVRRIPNVPVYGGDDRVQALTQQVNEGQQINIGSMKITCMKTPCHTSGHICYFIEDTANPGPPVVFTGDTLFQAGCGRFFEGTGEQMYQALVVKLGSLPPQTLVYCGHEYTVNNLKYAKHVEPDNPAVTERMAWAKDKRSKGQPTVPSTIEQEKTFNPFMRVNEDSVKKHAGKTDPIEVMTYLRKEKDHFKG